MSWGATCCPGLLHGATMSLATGFSAALASAAIGMMVGSIAGYYGGWLGDALMRVSEAFQSIPPFLQAIIIVALFGPSMWTIVAAIVAVSWSSPARLVRGETLRVRSADFIGACATFGMSDARIIVTQILPNCLPPLIVSTSVMVASAILLEAGLSFLGLGDPSQLSWGTMISIGRGALRTAWYMSAHSGRRDHHHGHGHQSDGRRAERCVQSVFEGARAPMSFPALALWADPAPIETISVDPISADTAAVVSRGRPVLEAEGLRIGVAGRKSDDPGP